MKIYSTYFIFLFFLFSSHIKCIILNLKQEENDMAKVIKDNRLTVNEAALIYCIVGSPDPKRKGKRIYPTIKESINYMMGGCTADPEENMIKMAESATTEQMTFC